MQINDISLEGLKASIELDKNDNMALIHVEASHEYVYSSSRFEMLYKHIQQYHFEDYFITVSDANIHNGTYRVNSIENNVEVNVLKMTICVELIEKAPYSPVEPSKYQPAIGEKCLYICTDGGNTTPMIKCTVLGYHDDLVWLKCGTSGDGTLVLKYNTVVFAPLPTPEQKLRKLVQDINDGLPLNKALKLLREI